MSACDSRLAVVGAAADEVAALIPDGVTVVRNERFDDGMGGSFAAGLRAVDADASAALVMLVDLPDVSSAVVQRVVAFARAAGDLPDLLCRAAFDGIPGHPVVLGRHHLEPAAGAATGDSGAREYLAGRVVRLVECGDLAAGRDVDRPS